MREEEAHEVIEWVTKVMYRIMVRPDSVDKYLSKLIKAGPAIYEAMEAAVKPEFRDLLNELSEVVVGWLKEMRS